MATSKKDYIAIAAIIKAAQHHNHLDRVAAQLADHFQQDNPKFDRERFLKACGVAS